MWKTIGISVLVILCILVFLYMIGKKSVHAEVDIDANPTLVWSILTDVENASVWNSVLVPESGQLKVGNTIEYAFYQNEGGEPSRMSAKVHELVEEQLINQKGGMPFVIEFDHRYLMEKSSSGTKLMIKENYRGIMVPFWNPQPVEQAYQRLLNALKKEAENR